MSKRVPDLLRFLLEVFLYLARFCYTHGLHPVLLLVKVELELGVDFG